MFRILANCSPAAGRGMHETLLKQRGETLQSRTGPSVVRRLFVFVPDIFLALACAGQ